MNPSGTDSGNELDIRVASVVPLAGWRKELADRMVASHLTYVPVTQMREVDASGLVDCRERLVGRLEHEHDIRLSYTHLLIKLVAHALREHSILNSSLVDDEIRIFSDINIGMAVALENGGVLTPVVRQADKKSIVTIAQEAVKFARQVRSRRFNLDDLRGGTFTVTNAGTYGTDFVTPVIVYPQSAVLGVGKLKEKPVVREGQIVIRMMMGLSLTYDHRIISGATSASFFQTLEEIVADPTQLDLGI